MGRRNHAPLQRKRQSIGSSKVDMFAETHIPTNDDLTMGVQTEKRGNRLRIPPLRPPQFTEQHDQTGTKLCDQRQSGNETQPLNATLSHSSCFSKQHTAHKQPHASPENHPSLRPCHTSPSGLARQSPEQKRWPRVCRTTKAAGSSQFLYLLALICLDCH